MTRLLPWLVLCAILAAPARARAADAPLRLAALYEVSSEISGASSSFLWEPAAGMVGSCGPAKGPAGLGRFEAEIVAHGLTPTLGIVLEGAAGALGPDQVRVSVGEGEARVVLRPAVAPRSIAVRIHGGGDPAGLVRATQLIATQLQMELCLEHKVGRGWTGGDATSLRQAGTSSTVRCGLDSAAPKGG